MNILEAVSAEGVKYSVETEMYKEAHAELLLSVCRQQRKLLFDIEDEKDMLIYRAAHEHYLRGLCMGLSFAETFLRGQNAW